MSHMKRMLVAASVTLLWTVSEAFAEAKLKDVHKSFLSSLPQGRLSPDANMKEVASSLPPANEQPLSSENLDKIRGLAGRVDECLDEDVCLLSLETFGALKKTHRIFAYEEVTKVTEGGEEAAVERKDIRCYDIGDFAIYIAPYVQNGDALPVPSPRYGPDSEVYVPKEALERASSLAAILRKVGIITVGYDELQEGSPKKWTLEDVLSEGVEKCMEKVKKLNTAVFLEPRYVYNPQLDLGAINVRLLSGLEVKMKLEYQTNLSPFQRQAISGSQDHDPPRPSTNLDVFAETE